MSEAIVNDNVKKGIDALIVDVHKHFSRRIDKIEKRFDAIEEKLSETLQIKSKDFGKAKKVAGRTLATAAKTAVDVELIASQEEVLEDFNMQSPGLLDRMQKGSLSQNQADVDSITSSNIIDEMCKDLDSGFDGLEKKLDNIERRIWRKMAHALDKDKGREDIEGEPKVFKASLKGKDKASKLKLKKKNNDLVL